MGQPQSSVTHLQDSAHVFPSMRASVVIDVCQVTTVFLSVMHVFVTLMDQKQIHATTWVVSVIVAPQDSVTAR